MIASGTKFWDLNTLLGMNLGESELSVDELTLYPIYTEDYMFTPEEIREARNSLTDIAQTQRFVVEQDGNNYALIGPLLPFISLRDAGFTTIPCILRSNDLPQIQQVLSIRLNADYCKLSPLVYARLIRRLERLFPVMKSITGMNLGSRREWIASVLGISSSAVLRYSYINKVPRPLQQRCNNKDFPYLCYKETLHFTESQFDSLLSDLIHYELHSRYQTISSSELTNMINKIRNSTDPTSAGTAADSSIASITKGAQINPEPVNMPSLSDIDLSSIASTKTPNLRQFPALYDDSAIRYYNQLQLTYEEQFDDEIASDTNSLFAVTARKDGYIVPDQTLRDISYQLYCLRKLRITSGQKLLDYACLRSILESISDIYSRLD